MYAKSAVIGFAYLAGLIIAFLLNGILLYSSVIITLILLAGFYLVRARKLSFGIFLIIFAVAFGVHGFYKVTMLDKNYLLDGETREIYGVVLEKTSPSHDMAGYIIEAVVDGVKIKFSLFTLDTGAEAGDGISFDVKFSLMRDNTAFSEASYYMSRGVFLKGIAKTEPVAQRNDNFSLIRTIMGFNEYLKGKIFDAFPNDIGALVNSIFFGDKSRLSNSLSNSIKRAGASHYAAVSGLHLTLLMHLFMSVINFTRLRVKRRLKFIILTTIIMAFMVFFNMSPSITRAGFMLIIFYSGELFMRRGNTLNSVGFAALIILLISPYAALDAGLLLSITGTIGIGVIAPIVNLQFKATRFKKIRESIISNICATWATLPLVAVFFGGASIVSVITSLILLPFFIILVVSIMIFALTAGVWGFPLLIAGLCSKAIETVVIFFGNLKLAYIPLDYGFIIPWIIASALLISVTGLIYKKTKSCVNVAIMSVFMLSMMIVSTEYLNLNKTTLEIYTDGNSSCVFLRYKNTSAVIVTDDGIRASYAVRDFIENNFLDEISLLLILNSTNNSLPYFKELAANIYAAPDEAGTTYDVSGMFTVAHENRSAFITHNETTISVSDVRSSAEANINITYNSSVNHGSFGGLVINTARRQEIIRPDELNAYYEKIRLILKEE